jgi:hypothetical protein
MASTGYGSESPVAMRGNQEDTNRLIMANQGMLPPEEFFNPENIQRILAKAQAAKA